MRAPQISLENHLQAPERHIEVCQHITVQITACISTVALLIEVSAHGRWFDLIMPCSYAPRHVKQSTTASLPVVCACVAMNGRKAPNVRTELGTERLFRVLGEHVKMLSPVCSRFLPRECAQMQGGPPGIGGPRQLKRDSAMTGSLERLRKATVGFSEQLGAYW
jgi:hypothetical protein